MATDDTEPSSPDSEPEKDDAVTLRKPGDPSTDEADVPEHWKVGDVILDTYEVKAELGAGAFGTVHKVHHKGWNTNLAVKSAKVPFDEEAIKREAEVWMELGLHPNIVSCFFVRNLGGSPRIFVEFVGGRTLHEWLYGRPPDPSEETQFVGRHKDSSATGKKPRELTRTQRLAIAIELCRGMHHAHCFKWKDKEGQEHEGVVHRDLKPLNILMTEDGTPRVTDFGLVGLGLPTMVESSLASPAGTAIPEPTQEDESHPNSNTSPFDPIEGSTQIPGGESDKIAGSPAYMAPEQWDPRTPTTKAADIYAFGVILYELFCGRRPFELHGKFHHALDELKLSEYERMHREETPPAPGALSPEIDSEVAALILKCLEKRPKARPHCFADVRDRLKAIYQRLEDEGYDLLRPEPKVGKLLADSLNNRALSYIELGQSERAEMLWQQALEVDAFHIASNYNLGEIEWRTGRIDDIDFVRRIERTCQEGNGLCSYLLGSLHMARRDGEAATRAFEAAAASGEVGAPVSTALQAARAIPSPLLSKATGLCLSFAEDRDSKVDLSGNGETAVTWGENEGLRVWKTLVGGNGGFMKCVPSESLSDDFWQMTRPISISFHGETLIGLFSREKTAIGVWDLRSGRLTGQLEGHTEQIWCVRISENGKWVLSGETGGNILLWAAANGACTACLQGHEGTVLCVRFSRDGKWGISGSADKTARIWELPAGQCALVLGPHENPVSSVALAADGSKAACLVEQDIVHIWDCRTGRELRRIGKHGVPISAVELSSDGGIAISGGDAGTQVWDTQSGQCLRTFNQLMPRVGSVRFSEYRKGALSLSRHGDSMMYIDVSYWLDLRSKKRRTSSLLGHSTACLSRPLGYANQRISSQKLDRLCKSTDKAIDAGDLLEAFRSIQRIRQLPGNRRHPELLHLSRRLAKKLPKKRPLGVWLSRSLGIQATTIRSITMCGKGQYALTSGHDGALMFWDLESGLCRQTLKEDRNTCLGYTISCLSHDGQWAFSGGQGVPRAWNIAQGLPIKSFENLQEIPLGNICFSPDDHWILASQNSVNHDSNIYLVDFDTGSCLRVFEGHGRRVSSAHFSPDGRWILSGSYDHTLRLWDVSTGTCIRVLRGHTQPVRSAAVSPDGRWAISGGGFGQNRTTKIRLWQLPDAECVKELETGATCINLVQFSSDGQWIVACTGAPDPGKDEIQIWNVPTGELVQVLEGHSHAVTSACLSPDGRQLLSGGRDRALLLWHIDWELYPLELADWHEGARSHLSHFLTLHTPYSAGVPPGREPTDEEALLALTRSGRPAWTERDFEQLLYTLGCVGYGWLRPEGVKRELEKMAADWDGPPDLFAEAGSRKVASPARESAAPSNPKQVVEPSDASTPTNIVTKASVTRVQAPSKSPTQTGTPSPDMTAGRQVILVIDHDGTTGELVEMCFRDQAYDAELLCAHNAEEARRLVRESGAQLTCVIIEHAFYDIVGGKGICGELRTMHSHAPIVLLSGFDPSQVEEIVRKEGLAGWLQNPFRPDGLVRDLRAILERRHAGQATGLEKRGVPTPTSSRGAGHQPIGQIARASARNPAQSNCFCTSCGEPLRAGVSFCGECGASVAPHPGPRTCTRCGAAVDADVAFCTQCGAGLGTGGGTPS